MSKLELEVKLEALEIEALQVIRSKFIQEQFATVKDFEELYKMANLFRKESRFSNSQMQKKIAKISEMTMEKIIHSLSITKLEDIIVEEAEVGDRFFLNAIIPYLHMIINDFDNLSRILPKLKFYVDKEYVPYVYTLLINLLDTESSLFKDLRCFELSIRYLTPKEIPQLCDIAKDNLLSYFAKNSWFYPVFYRYLTPIQVAVLHATVKQFLPIEHVISGILVNMADLSHYCIPEVASMVFSFAEELNKKSTTGKLVLISGGRTQQEQNEDGMDMQTSVTERLLP